MFELFVIGTFWFWALLAFEVILLFAFVEYENGVGATISLVIFACCLQWLGDVDLLGFVFGNPLQLFICVASYFLIGAIWGTVKWWIFCRDRLEEYRELKEEFLISKGLPAGTKVMPQEHKAAWKEKLERFTDYGRGGGTLAEAPRVKKNKSRIMRWMSFWPVSMIWSIINDFVKRIFKSIYYKIAGYLQHIADNMFGGIQDDLE
jgi:hypothetical protein